MLSRVLLICFLITIGQLHAQVDVNELVEGDNVRITLKNGGNIEGKIAMNRSDTLKVQSSLDKEYLIHHDSIHHIFSRDHKRYEYIFPEREEILLEFKTKIFVKMHDGQERSGRLHLVDDEFLHIRMPYGGILKIEISSIHYIKALIGNNKDYNIYGGLAIYPESFLTLNLDIDFKLYQSTTYKALAHFGIGHAVSFGGGTIYGNIGLRQCFGSDGKYVEVSGNYIFAVGSTSEFSIGYRSEKNKSIFRAGFSLIEGGTGGMYLSIGF